LAIYAHYDSQGEVKPFTSYYLRCLAEHCERIDFVSTANLAPSEVEKVSSLCERALTKENVGFDFGMWQHALTDIDLSEWDEIVITNSSIFGPVYPLAEMFDRMGRADCELWGVTDNHDIDWHLQSYFLAFRRPVLRSPSFSKFWDSVLPYENKFQVIRSYEVGMTQFLLQQGFRAEAYVPVATLFPPWPLNLRYSRRRLDATVFNPLKLLARRMPFVKASLLRENPGGLNLAPIYEGVARAGYDRALIELDPREEEGRVDGWIRKIRRRP
jgi:rhamnosyltransferase